ncbi:hypothetical protein M407DRAFT_115204 [Tulasnella calospora MUT 4182]|uniref:Uncharacterized protein n=1 Tax=Tulasnella calospora MUT 4182 TaxID=1051891 RepID=A0A0C3QC36_9AGAM|nr:hypothetical protein M407DRAFT_115204 [Tulasnella calospora MUT 4182]
MREALGSGLGSRSSKCLGSSRKRSSGGSLVASPVISRSTVTLNDPARNAWGLILVVMLVGMTLFVGMTLLVKPLGSYGCPQMVICQRHQGFLAQSDVVA